MVGENLLKEQCHKIVDLIKRLQRFRKLFRFHEGDCGPIIIYGSCREASGCGPMFYNFSKLLHWAMQKSLGKTGRNTFTIDLR